LPWVRGKEQLLMRKHARECYVLLWAVKLK